MSAKTETKKKLALPAVLAVVVIASGCGNAVTNNDAAPSTDGAVADAGTFDAGCVPPEVYDPVAHACVPIV